MASPEVRHDVIKLLPSIELGSVVMNGAVHDRASSALDERLADIAYVRANYGLEFHTRPSVADEAERLSREGFDIAFTNPHDIHALDPETQLQIDQYAAILAANPKEGAQLFLQPPAMKNWGPLTKRAIALHTLYGASTLQRLGEGIDPAIYDKSLFPKGGTMISANAIIRAEKADRPDKAEQIIGSYQRFVEQPIDPISRAFYQGSLDARAVRTRALTTIDEVTDHFANVAPGTKLKSASLACGAAGPVKDLIQSMEANLDVEFDEAVLVDKDPMALASAAALTEDIAHKVRIEHRNLLTEPLTDYIEPHSIDVVDLLGLFEYIPNDDRKGHWAAALLKQVKEIVKPGGVIVFGNMLADRDQQAFFSKVVKWPSLEQRTVEDVMDIVQEAGFDLSTLKTRIPAKEGVYAVYTIAVPGEEPTPDVPQTNHFAA